jgi:DNA helicase-2/ATP-dependent DNA helicase PcrA
MDLTADLNEEQAAAVTAPPGPILVLAGAGSGKTRVLTRRLAYLIAQGVPAHRLLAITFTNKAAREMAERVAALLGPQAAGMWIHTFHAACVRILRREIGDLGYASSFTILDADDQRTLIRECLRARALQEAVFPPAAVLAWISRAKNRLAGPAEALAAARAPWDREAARLFAMYQERCRASNALDFDDLIGLTIRLLEGPHAAAERYPEMFLHVLVDEYQDTNAAQHRLIRLLTARHRSLFCVGDVDQGIYGWRGADIANILRFDEEWPGARVMPLTRNYRSTRAILDAAGAVIAHNARKWPKRLWTDRGGGEPVTLYRAWDERDEAAFVTNEIAELHRREGLPYDGCAVLYRTHAQSRAFEDALMARGIPYRIFGGLRFYERKEIKDVCAYLRLLCNPGDWMAVQRASAVPRRGIGPATLERVRARVVGDGVPLGEALREQGRAGTRQLADVLDELRAFAAERSVMDIVAETMARSGIEGELRAEAASSLEARTRLENLGELLTVASAWPLRGLQGLTEFLGSVALLTDQDGPEAERPGAAPGVALMTLHAAKGLEFPVVFLAGLEEGVFPHSRALQSAAELEEERRLCYVGMTRARQRLYLTCARERTLYGRPAANPESRFLREIGPDRVRERRGPSARLDAAWSAGAARAPGREVAAAAESADADFRPGERVRHPRWGEGQVVAAQGRGPQAEVTVEFPDAGRRTLIVAYANLKRLP